ncbi:unnamed protein product [Ranitomeya imitator]|uniref:Uncharacterized protein n=1 Tax=Ranitomeya imitator TaxID=111125 RepID=A0ABN9KNR5_9NEOB|nr:unnamed protein product [Ranitomeya imitator]
MLGLHLVNYMLGCCHTNSIWSVFYISICKPKPGVEQIEEKVREHVRDIQNAAECHADEILKPIARHFKSMHDCNSRLLKIRGIDCIVPDKRGGDIKKKLAQPETRWIFKIDCVHPKGLNEILSFAPFL